MIIRTSRFGEVEIEEDKTILFPEGIPGFEGEQRFILLNEGLEGTPFWWLQSAAMEELCFLTVEPARVFPEYDFEIPVDVRQLLRVADFPTLQALAILTVRDGDLAKATVNLKAPVLVNPEANLGVQLILEHERFGIRQPLSS